MQADKPLKVFIVDDHRDVAEGLADVLRLHGHEVEVAFNGEQAVRIFRERDFDIAFMDVMMPGMNGVESFLAIRRIKPDAKVVMMTGYSVEQLLDQVVEKGAYGVMHKPVHMEDVLQTLERVKSHGVVMIADANPQFGTSIQGVLEKNGFRTTTARTGKDALNQILAGGVDILLTGQELPVLTGLDVLMELRKKGRLIPTVIVTEQGKTYDRLESMQGGATTGILTKPFNTEQLLQALSRFAQNKESLEASMNASVEGVRPQAEASAETQPTSTPVPPPSQPAEYAAPGDTPKSDTRESVAVDIAMAAIDEHKDDAHPPGNGNVVAPAQYEPPAPPAPPTQYEPPAPPAPPTQYEPPAPPAPPAQYEPPAPPAPPTQYQPPAPPAAELAPTPRAPEERAPASVLVDKDFVEPTFEQEDEGKGRILVVDDDVDMLEGLAEVLRTQGYVVETATNPNQAYEIIDRFEAQIALLDIRLGKSNGLDLITSLKETRPDIYCVMITGNADKESAITALKRGAFNYMTKPLHPQELFAVLDNCLDKFFLDRQLRDAFQHLQASKEEADNRTKTVLDFYGDVNEVLESLVQVVSDSSNAILRESWGPLGAKQYSEYAKSIRDSAMRIDSVLSNSVDLAKSEAKSLKLDEEEVEIANIARTAAQLAKEAVGIGGPQISVDVPHDSPTVWGDERLLSLAVANLLSNAVEFTPSEGHITLRLLWNAGDALVFEVRDTAPGRSASDARKAAELYGRTDGSSGGAQNSGGLGVTLVSNIARLHEGDLEVETQPGSGTTARLRLPPSRVIPAQTAA